jgi:hypothetical protein
MSPGRTLLVGTITSSTPLLLLLLLDILSAAAAAGWAPGAAPGSSTSRLLAGMSFAKALRSEAART